MFNFDFDAYTEDDTYMYCKNEEERNTFIDAMVKEGLRWCDGTPYKSFVPEIRDGICFFFNEGRYDYYSNLNAEVKENSHPLLFSDYEDDSAFPENAEFEKFLKTFEK